MDTQKERMLYDVLYDYYLYIYDLEHPEGHGKDLVELTSGKISDNVRKLYMDGGWIGYGKTPKELILQYIQELMLEVV
jgi:hypothetical protein